MIESKVSRPRDFASGMTVRLRGSEDRLIAGAIFHGGQPRIVRSDPENVGSSVITTSPGSSRAAQTRSIAPAAPLVSTNESEFGVVGWSREKNCPISVRNGSKPYGPP